jgi:glycosyltransferase involved in cell wall biosynthesis
VKKILHLIKGLGRGGAELLLLSAAPYLDRDRFHYEIAYVLSKKDALVPDLEEAGLEVHCLEGGSDPGWLPRLRRLVRERRIDLIHSHSPLVAAGARTALAGVRVRRVYTEHNVWECYRRPTYWANLLTFPRSHHVFAVSDHVRASIKYPWSLRRLPMPPVETLYHGLDPEAVTGWRLQDGARAELGIPDEAPVFGAVANFRPEKGHRDLVAAAKHVIQEIPEARLVLVGQGPLEGEVRRQVKELGLDRSVIFAGHRRDAPRIAGSFDVFTLASVHEGLAIALVEAMAQGVPAVVTRVGGLSEVVEHGKQGFIVTPGRPRALADAIVSLLRDPALRKEFGAAAVERARMFDIRDAVRRMEQVYGDLLGSER